MGPVAARLARRLGVVATTLCLALIGAVAVAAPAQAAGENCSVGHGYWIDSGSHDIHSYRYRQCDGQPEVPLATNIFRLAYSGSWEVVASGYGEAVYSCNGTQYGNWFRVDQSGQFWNTCG